MKHVAWLAVIATMISCTRSAGGGEATWKTIEVAQEGQVAVLLKFLPSASLGDEDWIALEFVNEGRRALRVTNASYRMESKTFSLKTGGLVRSHGLASGNCYDLFPDAWKTTPVSDVLIPKGTYRNTEHPSRCSSALLGLPPREGHLVKAVLHLDCEIEGGPRLSSRPEGVPFEFEWRYPDEKGFASMRERLRQVMLNPQPESHHCHCDILGALLSVPELAGDVSLDELLAAIDRRRGAFDGREALVSHLPAGDSSRPRIVEFYFSRLKKKDLRVCEDAALRGPFWDRSFIEPLVVIHESGRNSPPFRALEILARHSNDWKDDRSITRRLSGALLERYGMILRKKPEDLAGEERLWVWSSYAMDLALTRDPDVLPLLRPFLDSKEQVFDPNERMRSLSLPPKIPCAYRLCDFALDAVITLLDGDTEKAYADAVCTLPSKGEKPGGPISVETMTALRDQMIIGLKKRLAALDGR